MLQFSVCLAAALVLPVEKVAEVRDARARTLPGRVEAVQRVEVTPEVSGDIVEVCFANGALVKEGDVLYRLMSVKYESALRNAEAKVAQAKAKKEYAAATFARHRKLEPTKAVSKDAVENAKSADVIAAAELAAAEAELKVADYNLKRCEIRTPISGKAGSTRLTRGNPASPSTPLVTVVQIQPIRVRFSISNRDYLEAFGGRGRTLREKGEVKLTLADGFAYAEAGAVEYVENEVDAATDTLRVYATFPNAERLLKPGSTVGVTLSNRDGTPRPAVTPAAVLQDAKGPFVWRLAADGRAERRSIVRGRLANGLQLVESGLAAGDRVVSDGVHKVMEGDVVTPAK